MSQPVPFRPRSAAEQAAAALREAIAVGRLLDPLPGGYTLAGQLGVSRPTVRRALRLLEGEGVLALGRGRRARLLRRELPAARAGGFSVCVLSPGKVFSELRGKTVLETVRRLLGGGAGWEEIEDARLGGSAFRPVLEQLVSARPGACWVLAGSTPGMQAWFERARAPALVLGSCAPGVALPSVDLDYHAVGWHAAGQFVRRGHRRMALLLPPRLLPGDEASCSGFEDYLARRGLPPALRCRWPEVDADAGAAALDRLLDHRDRPTALLAVRPALALTALTHLLRRGIGVPKAVSLLCRDTEPLLQCALPALAHYRSDPAALARRALKIIRGRMAGTLRPPWPAVRLMPVFHGGETLCG